MHFELFVALRYLFARRRQAFISIISIMSVLGVGIGVAALVIVLGVYNGFTTDIRDKILGANAHIIVTGPGLTSPAQPLRVTAGDEGASGKQADKEAGKDATPESASKSGPDMARDAAPEGAAPEASSTEDPLAATLQRIVSAPGLTGATPFIYGEGMISSPLGVKGVVLRGVDPVGAPEVISMLGRLTSGSVAWLSPLKPEEIGGEDIAEIEPERFLPGVIVGRELALRLGLMPGSRVNLLSPAGQKSAAGFQPRIRPGVVAGVFHTGMFEYDSSLAFIALDTARDLFGLPAGRISGVEATVADVYAADKVAGTLQESLGPRFLVRNWMEMNANLFAALKLEKIGMFIVLAMVVLVGSFSIVTTLVMMVMEKRRDIAVLMSMGASRGMIRRIFMLLGTIIGAAGTVLGYILGIGLAMLLQRYQFIKLPPGVYTIDHLPMLLHWSDIVLVGVSALLLCFLATIYPARQAASLEPAEALRYE